MNEAYAVVDGAVRVTVRVEIACGISIRRLWHVAITFFIASAIFFKFVTKFKSKGRTIEQRRHHTTTSPAKDAETEG
jgi:hypothetical protein